MMATYLLTMSSAARPGRFKGDLTLNREKTIWIAPLMILGAAVCWGIIGLFTKPLSAGGLRPIQIAQIRNLLALIGFLLLITIRRGRLPAVAFGDLWLFLGTGVASIALFNTLYFYTMEMSTLAVASILLYTSPIFILLMARLFFKEELTRRKLFSVFLAITGCVFITGIVGGGQHIGVLTLITGLGSGFCYALYSIFGRVAIARYDSLTVITYTFLFSTLSLLPFSRPAEIYEHMGASPELLVYALLLAILSSMIPFVLYTNGLRHMDTSKAGILACIEPVVASLVSILVFHEAFGWTHALGIGLVLTSIAILNLGKRREEKTTRETWKEEGPGIY